ILEKSLYQMASDIIFIFRFFICVYHRICLYAALYGLMRSLLKLGKQIFLIVALKTVYNFISYSYEAIDSINGIAQIFMYKVNTQRKAGTVGASYSLANLGRKLVK